MAVSTNRDSLRYFVIVNVLPDWFKSVKFLFQWAKKNRTCHDERSWYMYNENKDLFSFCQTGYMLGFTSLVIFFLLLFE